MKVSGSHPATRADPLLPRPYRVLRVRPETPGVVTLDLVPAQEGERAPAFQPGQFNMLYVFGVGEAPLGICSDPADAQRRSHTVRAVGAVTAALKRLRKGDVVGVRGPFGRGWPEPAPDQDVVLVTGGLGLVPLRPVLYRLLSTDTVRQAGAGRRVVLLHGNRTASDIPYARELATWARRGPLEVQLTVDRATPAWKGRVGVVTRLIGPLPLRPERTLALVCGPEVMMRFAAAELQRRGVASSRIYISMERNMKCAVGICGRCQYGPNFVCKDGPVFRYDTIEWLLRRREI